LALPDRLTAREYATDTIAQEAESSYIGSATLLSDVVDVSLFYHRHGMVLTFYTFQMAA